MRYWDSSALVPLVVTESASERPRMAFARDAAITTWWATPVECVSAFARLEREGRLSQSALLAAVVRLRQLSRDWTQVTPSDAMREQAIRLVRVHTLRSADALQLAAAVIASDHEPRTLDFVTLDTRLAEAADKEGFRVVA